MEDRAVGGVSQEEGGGGDSQASGGTMDIHMPQTSSSDSEHTHNFESSVPLDVALKHRVRESLGIMGRGKVSLILSNLKPGPHVTANANFVNRRLCAECVISSKKSSSGSFKLTHYKFEREFPQEAEIMNVTFKVKKGHMKIYFDKITDFSVQSIWVP